MAPARAYPAATSWVKAARPRVVGRGRFAWRSFWGSLMAGLMFMSVAAISSPEQFGLPGRRSVATGWPFWLLVLLVALGAWVGFARRAHLRWLVERIREPFLRPLADNDYFEGATTALSACPGFLRTWFAFAWVWGPAAVWVLGAAFGFAVAYFAVDAAVARFAVGWGHPLLAAINGLLSLITFALSARRLSTWRFAASVHKEVTTGYPT